MKNINDYKIEIKARSQYRPSPIAINFGLVNIVDGVRKQVTSLYSCREGLCSYLYKYINDNQLLNIDNEKVNIDLNKLRIIFVWSDGDKKNQEAFKRNIFFAKKLINIIEKTMLWKKPSVISTAKLTHEGKALCPCWLITGPKEWMSYPQFLTTFLYITRLATSIGPVEDLKEPKTLEDIQTYLKLVKETENFLPFLKDWRVRSDRIEERTEEIRKAIEIFKYDKRIFKEVPLEEAWKTNVTGNFGIMAGIHNFVNGNYVDYNQVVKETYARYLELVK